jgi:hypothetical protein
MTHLEFAEPNQLLLIAIIKGLRPNRNKTLNHV